jgi:hypothetical protein
LIIAGRIKRKAISIWRVRQVKSLPVAVDCWALGAAEVTVAIVAPMGNGVMGCRVIRRDGWSAALRRLPSTSYHPITL